MIRNQVDLARAVGGEFASRKINSILALGIVIGLLVVGALAWLISMNAWWWLMAIPVSLLAAACFIAYLVVRRIIRTLRPDLTGAQADDVKSFVDKLERVAENLQTPMPFIIFRILRDILFPRKQTFIGTVTRDGSTLHKDFLELAKSFR